MEFYSSGKLMLTSEYMVLAGANALSVPTTKGQKMSVTPIDKPTIYWKSIDHNGNCWFENEFSLIDFSVDHATNEVVENRLTALLHHIQKNTSLFNTEQGYHIITTLEFDRQWGLGSSSTLIANLAKWSGVDPIALLHSAFKGSGYDVATGMENDSIQYRIKNGTASWEVTPFNPPFSHQLFFVYLGQKQQSEKEVMKFDLQDITAKDVALFDQLTADLLACKTLPEFSFIMTSHERELSDILHRPTIKYERFRDYPFCIKSLGGWGGDFVLVAGNPEDQQYFRNKGYNTILSWDEMVQPTLMH